MDLKLDNIQYLHLLWLIPVLGGLFAYGFSRKSRAMRIFATVNLFDRLMPTVSIRRQKIKAAILLGSIALLIFAATGPRWGRKIVQLQRKGIDIMVCLDVSRSMLAEDIAPNRLERAKFELGDMLSGLKGDRIGLVTFAGNAALTCPLTINYGAYRMALDEVDTRSTARGGSLIGDAIREAADSFADNDKGHKAILLITDGEDQASFPVEAARDAWQNKKIRVFTVGVGDATRGARIPTKKNGQGQFLQYKGEQVWSKLDVATLQEMAIEGGGEYYPMGTSDADFRVLYEEHIRRKVEARELEMSHKEMQYARFQWFAGLALLLLLIETLLSDRKAAASSEVGIHA
ncbi:MAG TPA: VWA domain-containing protein [Phycisphaerae bacterium]|nr:VWA domain-containing protein [Phycisphaerales bacterium]HNO76668.1 VWA domain-containing protein [Phycisphaerae bacterium]